MWHFYRILPILWDHALALPAAPKQAEQGGDGDAEEAV